MKKMLLAIVLLHFSFSSLEAQDELFESGLPKSKQAMLVVDVNLEPVTSNPLLAPMMNPRELMGMGPPIDAKDYLNVQRVTVFVGNPDIREDTADFVCRVKVKDKSKLPDLANKMFAFGRDGKLPSRKEDGWTILKSRQRWPEVIRYRDNTLEFGTSLYTFTPSRALVSKSLADSFGSMPKTSSLRMVLDAQVLGKFFDSVMSAEKVQENAVYEMIKWGEFVNEQSLALYGVKMLKELSTASLSVDLESDTLAKVSLVPMSGKEESVKAKAQVLHDFLMFHVDLPIRTLRAKENPVAEILQKIVDGMEFSTEGSSYDLTLAKPKDLSKEFLAIFDKMKVSFADQENSNLMKMVGLSVHNYHDTQRRFPFTKNPAEGDRFSDQLSWRVRVMPYCELNNAYDSMDVSQGWDAKVNQAVVEKGKSSFVLSNGAIVCTIKTDPPASSFRHILDGTSNTIMTIENRNAAMTPWTKPHDLTIDEAVKAVMNLKKGDFLWVGMYDGSVHKLRNPEEKGLTEKDLRNLFDPRDGMVARTEMLLDDPNPRLFDNIERPRRGYRFDEKKVDFGKEAAAIEEVPREAPRLRFDKTEGASDTKKAARFRPRSEKKVTKSDKSE